MHWKCKRAKNAVALRFDKTVMCISVSIFLTHCFLLFSLLSKCQVESDLIEMQNMSQDKSLEDKTLAIHKSFCAAEDFISVFLSTTLSLQMWSAKLRSSYSLFA